jgi:sterol desaturase/sphingolipid hydroxylase (fatty acid hydroxylase superfamily)
VRRSNVVYLLLYASGIYGLVLWPPLRDAATWLAEPLRRAIADDVARVPLVARCLVAFVAVDALAYWMHRAAHANALLWRLHRVHHGDPELGVLTTFRFHFGEIAWRMLLQFLPLHLLGIAASIPGWTIAALLVFNVLAHSGRDWHFGILGQAVVSPAYHRTHHRGDDANYGMYLTVWDAIFGTRR